MLMSTVILELVTIFCLLRHFLRFPFFPSSDLSILWNSLQKYFHNMLDPNIFLNSIDLSFGYLFYFWLGHILHSCIENRKITIEIDAFHARVTYGILLQIILIFLFHFFDPGYYFILTWCAYFYVPVLQWQS